MAYVKKIKPVPPTINKFEQNDTAPEPTNNWSSRPLAMDDEFKIISMKNAIKILPPNMIIEGRHRKENVQAICGFMVTDKMMDEAYEGYTHPSY